MELRAFSVSLSVKDLDASRAFYSDLGFSVIGGDHEQFEIMTNGTTVIGLFHGMFEGNILTFNPGWDHQGNNVDSFTDIRSIADSVRESGHEFASDTTGDEPEGPASFMVMDPDGNPILFDQHR
jgi:catechol 2,3-dioxygenase-like lactoylglutathione lyase family enzyme